ncbi:putative disease resistance protein RGA1 [Beta vulgaris subsp. vulgaris]|uniref:putative disease resistance protein RGA1 n=1 Tax=Beta vulgaris subsp. vulgaris TaxID=3555 RepID=UPI00053FE2CE|nr:putative disease resistance protein RGA1 [Beta vulgaris subsp. vulgaris]
MAESLSTGIVKVVVERPLSEAYEKIKSALVDFKSNMESLQNTRTTIEAVLLDADSMVDRSSSHTQQDALKKLSCQLDRLVDLLDAREARAMRKQVMGGSWFIKEACLFFSPSNQLVARFMDAWRVKDIRNQLDSISRDHAQFGSIVNVAQTIQRASSHVITDMVIGREGAKENIISRIIPDNNYVASESETLSVTSIIGIGGIGKTTLARFVYCDERVKRTFDVLIWVDVSRDFDVKEVLEKIAKCAINDTDTVMSEMNQSYQYYNNDQFIGAIIGKKFLLVLDNIWDQQGLRLKWIDLKKNLEKFGAPGSQVLITTRDEKVAGILNSKHPYKLGDLTESDSWLLFQQLAFTWWQESGVEAIGKDIAKMCPNVPLVIRSVAGLLAGKRTIQEWRAFRDDQLVNFASYGRDVMQTLKLSFDQLDAKSKLCVTYSSLFHKGFDYRKDALINLWVALGYVEPQYRDQSLEEAGEEILINLVNCGFYQLYESDMYGLHMTVIVMHDLMHDLVVSLAGYKYKMADLNTHEFDKRVRHVSVCKQVVADTSWAVPSSLFKIKHLRSFIMASDSTCKIEVRNWSICDDLLGRFRCLRVLILRRVLIKKLPRSVGELLSLHYLDLSRTAIVKLPNSVTHLVNLLSLHLYECDFLREMPEDMSNLVKLRHLQLQDSNNLIHMPTGLGRLTELRMLDMFVVSKQSYRSEANAIGGLADLEKLNNIEGGLTIKVRRESKDIAPEARAANLKMKDKLTQFYIEFEYSTKEDEMVLEGLHPHANLKFLEIKGYGGERLPSWMMDDQLHIRLPNLMSINIQNCKSCRYLCSLGRLPHLRRLYLRELDNVEYIESNANYNNDSTMWNEQC